MWRGILGHDDVVERFRRTLAAGRLASTYLFVGPEAIGKRRFARELAKTLLCPACDPLALAPCDACESCRLFDAGNHPDFELLGRLPDKGDLIIEQFVGDQQHRNQEGLCHWISFRPFICGRRVAIIDDGDHFNPSSANCLLKTLEEPPPHSLVILLGTSLARQLPTIRSRAQIVPFRALPTESLQEILLAQSVVADLPSAVQLVAASGGNLARAWELADPEVWAFRSALVGRLSRLAWDLFGAEKAIMDFVQAAGTESSARRERLRSVISMVLESYRQQLKSDAPNATAIPALLDALEACVSALEQVDRNANQALVVSHWLAVLAGQSQPLSRISA